MVTTIGRWQNWAGNQSATPAEIRTPSSAEEVSRAVHDAAATGRRVRMTGTGHSFTPVALTDGVLLRPAALTGIREVGDGWVTAEAGTTIGTLNGELHRRGLALANMGDIDAQTVSGAIQTGTHGTGRDVGGLADQVLALEMVLADGEIVTVRGDGEGQIRGVAEQDLFDAARVGLGALGVVTAVTFRVEPSFLLRSTREPMTLTSVLGSLDSLVTGNEHLDFFWMPHTDTCLTKLNNRSPGPPRPASTLRHWVDNHLMENILFGAVCGVGRRYPGAIPRLNALSAATLSASTHTDASHRIFTSVREVRFLEMEYAISREHLGQALREVRDLLEADRTGRSASRSRCGSPRPRTPGCPPPTAGTRPTSPAMSTGRLPTPPTSKASRRS